MRTHLLKIKYNKHFFVHEHIASDGWKKERKKILVRMLAIRNTQIHETVYVSITLLCNCLYESNADEKAR